MFRPQKKTSGAARVLLPGVLKADGFANQPMYGRSLRIIDRVAAWPLPGLQLQSVSTSQDWKKSAFWLPGISRIDGQSFDEEVLRARDELLTNGVNRSRRRIERIVFERAGISASSARRRGTYTALTRRPVGGLEWHIETSNSCRTHEIH